MHGLKTGSNTKNLLLHNDLRLITCTFMVSKTIMLDKQHTIVTRNLATADILT